MIKKKANGSHASTIEWLVQQLQPSFDIVNNTLQLEDKKATLLYIKSVSDSKKLQEYIIKPFFEMASINHYEAYLSSLPQSKKIVTKEQTLLDLTKGHVLVEIGTMLYLIDNKKVTNNVILETNMEPTIQGPELGLSEDLQTNVNLIRLSYPNPSFKVETYVVGKKNNQTLAIMYDSELVNQKVLKNLKSKIEEIDKKNEILLASSELQFF